MEEILYLLDNLEKTTIRDLKVHALLYILSQRSNTFNYEFDVGEDHKFGQMEIYSNEINNEIQNSDKINTIKKTTFGGGIRQNYRIENKNIKTKLDNNIKNTLDNIINKYGDLPISNLLVQIYDEKHY